MNNDQRNLAISLIDRYLTFLGCANQPLKRFDKSLLLTPDYASAKVGPDEPVCFLGATASDLDYAWTMRILGKVGDHGEGLFSLYENKTVPVSAVSRFKTRMPNADPGFFECFSRHSSAEVFNDGNVKIRDLYIGHRKKNITIFDPDEWATTLGLMTSRRCVVSEQCIKMMLGVAFFLPTFWVAHVSISDETPRVSLITDPTGVKELWKFRDIPEGKSRRDALLHWVSDHWRMNRKDPDVETYVRQHLRGKQELRCSGLSVEISPSLEDKARLNEIVDKRIAIKSSKKDKRRRRP
jgi:hypothetical protein